MREKCSVEQCETMRSARWSFRAYFLVDFYFNRRPLKKKKAEIRSASAFLYDCSFSDMSQFFCSTLTYDVSNFSTFLEPQFLIVVHLLAQPISHTIVQVIWQIFFKPDATNVSIWARDRHRTLLWLHN